MAGVQYSVEHPARTARRYIVERWMSTYPDFPIIVDNGAEFEHSEDVRAWARVTVVPGPTAQVSMGDLRRFRDSGVVIVQVFNKEHEGTGQLEEFCSFIRLLMQGKTIDEVLFKTTAVVRAGQQNSWMQYNAITSYQYDYLM